MKKILKRIQSFFSWPLCIAYCLTIVIFAAIYFFNWWSHPDRFIINDRLNKVIIDYNFENIDTNKILNSSSLYDNLTTTKRKLALSHIAEKEIKKNLKETEDSIHILIVNYQEKRMNKLDSLTKFKTDSLNEYYSKLLEDSVKCQSPATNPSEIMDGVLCKIRIDSIILKKRTDSLKISYDKADLFLKGFKFGDPELHNRILSKQELEQNLYNSYFDNLKFSSDLTNKFYDIVSDIRQLYNEINYWDFLFYSIGIATTTTFGDIIAVDFFMRLAACIELLVCVVLLALLLNRLKNSQK